ncbi:Nudix family hydrolase [Gilvimarinus agarilyticus]|uniref:Nudix family hydrolase n=1 Tax=Gilvimarinus sp. 2_MG-2023 TaxID=3062666 RepID=UPI001C095F6D|nr:Nudix family hydrolase [Gilvimarinus sp. 2_MG-2023]MBU2885412.1 Nudix family hydrolase [Gilvimarinus agarilyticus]MDO6570311.1 Nudix family hydrolase [Gilvimarinus sp. 2_MG-2023]
MKRIQVAVGVVQDTEGRILIAKRPEHAHQGGLWEFPGGKIESGETLIQALDRELFEELDIRVDATTPVIDIIHDYPDKQVCLQVHKVDSWRGLARGKEGQPICWVAPQALSQYTFPAANYPILNALQLPDRCLITGKFASLQDFSDRLQRALLSGIAMVQVRAHHLCDKDYKVLAQRTVEICKAHETLVLLNHSSAIEIVNTLGADGVHLSSAQLQAATALPQSGWVGASCHNRTELARAESLGVHYASLSPVQVTASHPQAAPLGWPEFTDMVRMAKLPIYALGGMVPNDLRRAKAAGAQGIGSISAWW